MLLKRYLFTFSSSKKLLNIGSITSSPFGNNIKDASSGPCSIKLKILLTEKKDIEPKVKLINKDAIKVKYIKLAIIICIP